MVRKVFLSALGLVAAFSLGPVAHADPQVTPFGQCVWNNGNGTYTAVYGYKSTRTTNLVVPAGDNNAFLPAPPGLDAGQPTTFTPGTHNNAFVVTYTGFRGQPGSLWYVDGETGFVDGSVGCLTKPVSVVGSWLAVFGLLGLAMPFIFRGSSRRRKLLGLDGSPRLLGRENG